MSALRLDVEIVGEGRDLVLLHSLLVRPDVVRAARRAARGRAPADPGEPAGLRNIAARGTCDQRLCGADRSAVRRSCVAAARPTSGQWPRQLRRALACDPARRAVRSPGAGRRAIAFPEAGRATFRASPTRSSARAWRRSPTLPCGACFRRASSPPIRDRRRARGGFPADRSGGFRRGLPGARGARSRCRARAHPQPAP